MHKKPATEHIHFNRSKPSTFSKKGLFFFSRHFLFSVCLADICEWNLRFLMPFLLHFAMIFVVFVFSSILSLQNTSSQQHLNKKGMLILSSRFSSLVWRDILQFI